MTNPNNIVQGKHLESLASDTRSYILAKDLEVIRALQADLAELTFTIGTVSSTVEGAMWLED